MNIKPQDKTIRDLLGSKRTFIIPRFQREYSWDQKHYREFIEDMLGNLVIDETGTISAGQYFIGTMLFIGDFTEGTGDIDVVDGQQRLTTITILFSAMYDRFVELKKDNLAKQLYNYIMTENDDGEPVRILKSKSSYPFFSYVIQEKESSYQGVEPVTEEEANIKATYDYFKEYLNESKLKKALKISNSSEKVGELSEVDILKAVRDQVLNSMFIAISTKEKDQAYRIFEILNAKGKRLGYTDLIKNRIFEILKEQEPADFAEETWKDIKEELHSGRESVELAQFYRHFWLSKYRNTQKDKLYDEFCKGITEKESCKEFLKELLENAKLYMKLVNPKREDYEDRKEYFGIVQSLKCINNYFNVVQVRIALLALFDAKKRGIIDFSKLKKTVLELENFHFAYNAVLSRGTNRIEAIFSKFAVALRNALQKNEANGIIETQLINKLGEIFPSFDSFSEKFISLSFTKKETASNVKAKYAINKLNCYYSDTDVFADDGSIEHIVPETEGGFALNIGNLILLEKRLNDDAGNQVYSDKRKIYEESTYRFVKDFIEKHDRWDESMIAERAKELARIYYREVLKKEIPSCNSK